MNVFKPGTGTITVWENTGGTRGPQLYQLKGIPLTPGPLVVVLKVASSVVKEPDRYWPPALPDAVETIAASYVQTSTSSKVRLFNLSPNTQVCCSCSARPAPACMHGLTESCGCHMRARTVWLQVAGMACSANGTQEIASNVKYSLGSPWYDVPTSAATFTIHDDLTGSVITSREETPPAAPIGYTNMLIGLQGGSGSTVVQLVPLADAPEGGLCKP